MDYTNIDGSLDFDAIDRLVKKAMDAGIMVTHASEQYEAETKSAIDKLGKLNTLLANRVKELEAENKQLKEEIQGLKKRLGG